MPTSGYSEFIALYVAHLTYKIKDVKKYVVCVNRKTGYISLDEYNIYMDIDRAHRKLTRSKKRLKAA